MHRLRAKSIRKGGEDQADPMDGIRNLADAMLVLAVGIMLALIINWKLDISTGSAQGGAGSGFGGSSPLAIDGADMENAEEQDINEEEMIRVGSLYYDEETGMYYAVSDPEDGAGDN